MESQPIPTTVAEYIAALTKIKRISRDKYEYQLSTHIAPFFAHITCGDITRHMVQKFVNHLQSDKELSPATIHAVVGF